MSSPSLIIPYNNNALMEESIVWDGAYPGAMVTQAKHGDIIELPTGKYSVLGDKEELPEGTPFYGKYRNGDIITMIKKSEPNKIFSSNSLNISGDEADVAKTHNEYHRMYSKKELPAGWTMKDLVQKHTAAVEALFKHLQFPRWLGKARDTDNSPPRRSKSAGKRFMKHYILIQKQAEIEKVKKSKCGIRSLITSLHS